MIKLLNYMDNLFGFAVDMAQSYPGESHFGNNCYEVLCQTYPLCLLLQRIHLCLALLIPLSEQRQV